MNALVTGGAGFIGTRIAAQLLRAGHEVTLQDTLDPRVHASAPPLPEGARFVQRDVREGAAPGRFDVIFHEAAMVGVGRGAADAEAFLDVNVRGTLALLRSLEGRAPERIVLASSMAIYGEGAYSCPQCNVERAGARRDEDLARGMWEPRCNACGADLEPRACDEQHAQRPRTAYAISKQAQEALALSVGREVGIPVVALRYHNVYGPGMPRGTPYAGVASLFKSRILAGEAPWVHEDGGQLRDFVHVEDVARANLLAAQAPLAHVAFEAFNVGSGTPRPILDLAASLSNALRPDLPPKLSGTYRAGDARHVYGDATKARRVLGLAPSVSFEQGVAAFAAEPMREAISSTPP